MSKFYARSFLNRGRGLAAIEVECSVRNSWVDAQLSLTDCSRKVTIDLGFGTKKHRRERLQKLDLLIGALTKLRTAVNDAKFDPEGDDYDSV